MSGQFATITLVAQHNWACMHTARTKDSYKLPEIFRYFCCRDFFEAFFGIFWQTFDKCNLGMFPVVFSKMTWECKLLCFRGIVWEYLETPRFPIEFWNLVGNNTGNYHRNIVLNSDLQMWSSALAQELPWKYPKSISNRWGKTFLAWNAYMRAPRLTVE